jgi:hypothetical protein
MSVVSPIAIIGYDEISAIPALPSRSHRDFRDAILTGVLAWAVTLTGVPNHANFVGGVLAAEPAAVKG